MKVLWLGGIVLPRIAKQEGLPMNYINGWLIKLSEELKSRCDIDLVYVFDSERPIEGKTEYYSYYGIKCDRASTKRYGDAYISQAVRILEKERPDVVHIWGTETPHSLAMTEACERIGILNRVVISIQGLVSFCCVHYYAHLPYRVVRQRTLRDCVKGNVFDSAKAFRKAGELEREAMRKVGHIIGRTDWDRACTWHINPDAQYHINNETLRNEFYEGSWDYNSCEKHSIFCSQANYPIKGIHLMLEAFARVVREYPDAHLYVGGKDYMRLPFWRQSAYGMYLVKLIKQNHLERNVTFTGFLNAEQMKQRYLQANVFVSPSSIENSPNSLGEAMILGVPCIASRVGGVHNLLEHGREGYLYPADEPYMLAYYICRMFGDPAAAAQLGYSASRHAAMIHDPEKNRSTLTNIYNAIISEGMQNERKTEEKHN